MTVMAILEEELPPSKLGTKAHWDEVYDREVRVFKDVGDEGEIWFGESSVTKMRHWATKHLPLSPPSSPLSILECGSGNGTLLLSFLSSPADSPVQSYNLTGIDYSPKAAILAAGVESAKRDELEEDEDEEELVINDVPPVSWRTGDLLRDEYDETWDLVLDKGTFDALCLSSEPVEEDRERRTPSLVYPERVARLVKKGGFFLITSCNFTEEEIKRRWTVSGLGFAFHSSVPHPTFTFGGKKGTTVCTVAVQKVEDHSFPTIAKSIKVNGMNGVNGVVQAKVNGDAVPKPNGILNGDGESLYICIDCGGTKTDVAIASSSAGIVSRGVGGTGNMAEVGLQLSYEIICSTVLEAIKLLPAKYKSYTRNANGECPILFADAWVGISGCDTPTDQKRMSDLLSPFFGVSSVPILNDAHLLGGALLRHRCPWGIAVIAGTGSVVISLEVDQHGSVNQTGRRGGLGYLLGDDGSAFDLGRCAIRAAMDDFDEGLEVEGGLAATIRKHFSVETTGEILAKVYDLDPALSASDATNLRKLRISALSRPILASYSQSPPDPISVRAVEAASKTLIASIVSLVKQKVSSSAGGSSGALRVQEAALVCGGGVVRQEVYRDLILRGLKEQGVVFGVVEVVDDVAGEGALGLAEKAKR